jgi:hypothetical protein
MFILVVVAMAAAYCGAVHYAFTRGNQQGI